MGSGGEICIRLASQARTGLDGGHAPAGIALMAGEAWAYLMRGRPAQANFTPVAGPPPWQGGD